MSKFSQWQSAKVRAIGSGNTYIRFTPFFGFRLTMWGKTVSYSSHDGWAQQGWIVKQRQKKRRGK